jgi:hypothetical protein
MAAVAPSYNGFRYPAEVISHCVWLYHRFALSFREVEEMMIERGIVVSYETIRQWCQKLGQTFANQLRRRRPRPGDKWHLDEVFIRINGRSTTCGGLLSTAKLWSPLVAKKKSPPLGGLITCAASGVRRCGRRGCSSGGVVRAG